jgi:hypothetical protein
MVYRAVEQLYAKQQGSGNCVTLKIERNEICESNPCMLTMEKSGLRGHRNGPFVITLSFKLLFAMRWF